MSRSTKSSLAALLIALGSAPATADGLELIGSGISLRAEVGTSAEVSDESSDIAATDLLTGTTLNIQGLYRWRNALGHEIRLEPGLTTTFFPSDSDLDDFDVSLFGEYRFDLAQLDRTQLRLRFGVDRNARFTAERFRRYTAQAALNIRRDGGQSMTYTLRYRHRDQNEATSFDGFDQDEFAGNARFARFSRDRTLELLAVTPFFDIRDADAANFDFKEVGARIQARYRLADDLTLTARGRASYREFGDDFSAVFPIEREDRRTSADLELRKDIGERGAVFGSIGYDRNNSNVPVRDFSGATFRLGFEFK